MKTKLAVILLLVVIVLAVMGAAPVMSHAQSDPAQVALAYVWRGTVALADAEGNPLVQPGPSFGEGQGARLFWSPDAKKLYTARADGLFATGAAGGASVRIATGYGRTLAISQDENTLYYLETVSPQPVEDVDESEGERVSFPFRAIAVDEVGGTGRLAGYFGRYDPASAVAEVTFAAARYARDGGLLGPGRPHLWPTYGANIFGTCCFPAPGLGIFDVNTGDFAVYDPEFVPGAAALNLTRTHLAGPTTGGTIRVYDLLTGGTRDYVIEIAGGLGTIERLAWSPDDTYLYIVARQPASNPLELTTDTAFPADLRSADVIVYRLNLVTSVIRELAYRRDVFGVSSLAATDRYVFATVVDPNAVLVERLNARQVPPGSSPTDPALAPLWPATHLWRIDATGEGEPSDILDDVWGLAARPVRGTR